jgi:hypothetical protein
MLKVEMEELREALGASNSRSDVPDRSAAGGGRYFPLSGASFASVGTIV